jgi:hypothetical protein
MARNGTPGIPALIDAHFGWISVPLFVVSLPNQRCGRIILTDLNTQLNGSLALGTAMSGTDMYVGVFECILLECSRRLGSDLVIKHVFSCENVAFKRDRDRAP